MTCDNGFPKPGRRDGKEPCGECHIGPEETCDICGARHAEQAGAQVGGVAKITLAVADEMRFHMENAHEGVCRLSPSVIAGWRRHLAALCPTPPADKEG